MEPKFEKLNEKDFELLDEAIRVSKHFADREWRNESMSSVGAAVRTEDGKVFSGPNLQHPHSAPTSLCGETVAIGKAYSEGYKTIESVVAYHYTAEHHQKIITPCGQCLELMRLFGNPWVFVPTDNGPRKIRLNDTLTLATNW
jgi:cytidine deaminase